MKKNVIKIMSLIMICLLGFFSVGCSKETVEKTNGENVKKVVTTTTMLEDLAKNIGGDSVEVKGLMPSGVDPHLYKASAGDVTTMQEADMVIYNGLHLEGKMGEVLEQLSKSGKVVTSIENGLDKGKLIKSQDGQGAYDPHVWFNAELWKDAAKEVNKGLKKLDPENSTKYDENLKKYLVELDDLHKYIKDKVNSIPSESRVLVTAHDAFNYFGNEYDVEVKGLQGISTASEAGTADVRNLADYIVEKKIKAVFVESSVPKKNIEALREAVKAKGFDVSIGGSLYSDSLGDKGTELGTYIGTFKENVNTIVNALK